MHKVEAKAEIRQALDRPGGKARACAGEINRAVEGYVDNIPDDAVYGLERELT
jgi:hypothetical protein